MNFLEILQTLKEHQELISLEVLRQPSIMENYSEHLAELNKLAFSELVEFENDQYLEKNVLGELTRKLNHLKKMPKLQLESKKLELNLKRKLNVKKLHELEKLSMIFSRLKSLEMIDVGGGQGHSSQVYCSVNSGSAYSYDKDLKLQQSGKQKILKWLPNLANRVNFVHKKINPEVSFGENKFLYSLHGCGDLSVNTIQASEFHTLLNFGCCYHKLSLQNISKKFKDNGFVFTNNALHLATRSHSIITEHQLQERLKVKTYRYVLHFLQEQFLNKSFSSVGNGHADDYSGEFSEYALKFEPQLQLDSDQIETFYKDNKNKAYQIFLMDLLRGRFGRIIEIYLLLDRCEYIRQKGGEAFLCEVFERSVSPRNIALTNFSLIDLFA